MGTSSDAARALLAALGVTPKIPGRFVAKGDFTVFTPTIEELVAYAMKKQPHISEAQHRKFADHVMRHVADGRIEFARIVGVEDKIFQRLSAKVERFADVQGCALLSQMYLEEQAHVQQALEAESMDLGPGTVGDPTLS